MILHLANCQIYMQDGPVKADLLIEDGKIVDIGPGIKPPPGQETLDLQEKIAVPGFIDPHVHFRVPGLSHKEDWHTGSAAAAHGGITTVLDMPNTNPPTISVESLAAKRSMVAGNSFVNYGFHFGTTGKNREEIARASNIPSVKLFLNPSTGKMMLDKISAIRDSFAAAPRMTVHAEGDMVDLALEMAFETGTDLYLCHISTKEEIRAIREAKRKAAAITGDKIRIYCEVTPHHLFLTEESFRKEQGFCFMKPALKTREDQQVLWQAVRDGTVDTIGSDHAPHTVAEKKAKPWPAGVPGVETTIPLLLNEVHQERLTIPRIVALCSGNPARFFHLKNKGELKIGEDGDVTVLDLELTGKIDEKRLLTKCGWSPFKNRTLQGWPVMTIVRGRIVYDGKDIQKIYHGIEVTCDG